MSSIIVPVALFPTILFQHFEGIPLLHSIQSEFINATNESKRDNKFKLLWGKEDELLNFFFVLLFGKHTNLAKRV